MRTSTPSGPNRPQRRSDHADARSAGGARLLSAGDLSGVRTSGLLVDGRDALAARKRSRRLGLPFTLDDTGAWAALGALATLLRVVDDGSRRATVIDACGPRTLFTRWADAAGFVAVPLDVTQPSFREHDAIDKGVDLVVRLHPHSPRAEDADIAVALGADCLRKGGVIVTTVRLGPAEEGGMSVADVRSFLARMSDQGLDQLGSFAVSDHERARAAQAVEHGSFGLALLAFRRR